ncbi:MULTISPECIES: helix-turn-helix domain-containing protein [unclassified Bradyrhizobium]|uniref:helix-turn-helix domain-containing protein n=1 Tax=unclassified Bradyrhizobium TaxID=2631580 RepID=UPI0028EC672A|nr:MULTISPECIES: helix-turn-helix domain-containing protein [unclassified Bradyrhizobium]
MKSQLPAVLQEIADVAGETAALKIAAQHGGRRVYFPSVDRLVGVDGEHYWLIDCVGYELARKICEHFQVDGRGQRIEIPLYVGGTYRQFMRSINKRVHEMEADGASSAEIAKALGVTQRTVHRHRSRHRGRRNNGQSSLF